MGVGCVRVCVCVCVCVWAQEPCRCKVGHRGVESHFAASRPARARFCRTPPQRRRSRNCRGMPTCQNLRCQSILEYLAAGIGLEAPACLRKVQYNGTTETYTAVLETEETDTGATVRFEIVILRVTILQPGEEHQ